MIKNLALEASAGSGKTYALSVRYLSLMFLGSIPEEILTLTFTNKAAQEMKKRIFDTLKELGTKSELDDICELTRKSRAEILLLKPKIELLFLRSDLKISTIDSFFSSILRKFSFNVGLMPDFGLEESMLSDDLIQRFLKISKNAKLYKSLVLFSINEKRKLSDIFLLFSMLFEKHGELNLESFAKKSFEFPNEREVLGLMDEIRRRFKEKGLGESALKTLEVSNVKSLLEKKFLARSDFGYWSYKKYTDEKINTLLDDLKKRLFEFTQAKENYLFSQISKLYESFEKALKVESKLRGTLSFSQMTNRLFDILGDEIGRDFLYFRLDGSFKHLLIDEFQDTSIVQYKILEPFMQEIVAGVGVKEKRSLFLVGDTKQSIYRFRGGAKELFSYASKILNLDKGVLKTNYRSSVSIVNFINETFKGKIEGYKEQTPKDGALDGAVRVYKNEEVSDSLLECVKELLGLGIAQNNIAVLCYTNQEALLLKELIEDEIAGAKVTMEATRKLIDIPIISAIIDFIHYLYFKDELYLENFRVESGRDYRGDGAEFDTREQMQSLVVKIIRHFDIFDFEDDLLLFIQSCAKFRDIEEFLFNYQDISSSSVSKESEGIRVLTIHKSKGLEFSNVLVMDRLKRARSGGETFIFEYDDIRLENMFLKVKSREFFDSKYKEAKDKESIKKHEDSMNTQYVAMTRARDNLFVFAKEKSSAFCDLYLNSYRKGEIYVKDEIKSDKKELIYTIAPRKYGIQEIDKIEDESLDTGDFRAVDFGLALHYMLEMLGKFDINFMQSAYEAMKNRYSTILGEDDLIDIKKRVLQLVGNHEFLTLIKGAKLLREQPIFYNLKRKQLDLLAEFKDKVVVIDYKSSPLLHSSHVRQISVYKKALQSIYDKECEAYLCYLKEDDIKLIKV